MNGDVLDNDLKELTDVELFTRYSTGEEAAFREIVDRHKYGLYAFLWNFLNRNDLLEDVFQETFLQLFRSWKSFDKSRPLRPWLFAIAANKARDALRKWRRTSAVPIGTMGDSQDLSFDDMLNTVASDSTLPYDELQKNETALRVGQIMAGMPENLREILLLSYFQGFSYKQMAEFLGIPIVTVKSRLHTAVGRFAKDWKNQLGAKMSND